MVQPGRHATSAAHDRSTSVALVIAGLELALSDRPPELLEVGANFR
jgi:hypothetical protein